VAGQAGELGRLTARVQSHVFAKAKVSPVVGEMLVDDALR
jgi:hypothetical protein